MEGEREQDRVERLEKFEEQMKEKEATPPEVRIPTSDHAILSLFPTKQ